MTYNKRTNGVLTPDARMRLVRHKHFREVYRSEKSRIGDTRAIVAYPQGLKKCRKDMTYKMLYMLYSYYAKFSNYVFLGVPTLYRWVTSSDADIRLAVRHGNDFGMTNELSRTKLGRLKIAYKQVLWSAGRVMPFLPATILVDVFSPSMRCVRKEATTPLALHIASYDYDTYRKNTSYIDRFFLDYWAGNSIIAQATYNRLEIVTRIVEDSLENAIERGIHLERKICIVSIASGSAIATIDGIRRYIAKQTLGKTHDIFDQIDLYLVDPSQEALHAACEYYEQSFGTRLAKAHNIQKKSDVGLRFLQRQGVQVDILEMNGLADYFTWDALRKNIKEVYATICDGGCMIMSNIIDNDELMFFEHALYWPMIPKSTYDFLGSMTSPETFASRNVEHVVDPYSFTYTIARAWKR